MKVAIQGASGFVGSRLVERLHLGGLAEVVPIVRSHASLTRIARFDLGWKMADGLDEEALTEAFAGCEVVFMSVGGTTEMLLGGPGTTARAARRAGVRRIVYLSTGVTLGFDPAPGTDDETPPLVDQPWMYNRSKAIAENLIGDLRRDTGMDFVVLRPTIVFGPRSESWTTKIAERFLWHDAFLVDGGNHVCNTVYVDNLVDAMWLAAIVPEAANQRFLVGDRERVTWADLYRSVADAIEVSFDEAHLLDGADIRANLETSSGSLAAKIKRQLQSDRGKRLIGRIPVTAKSRVRRLQMAWATPPSEPVNPDPRDFLRWVLDEELLVQMTDTHLPITKAERILGYDPIPFAEGARRSGIWLREMGFGEHPGR